MGVAGFEFAEFGVSKPKPQGSKDPNKRALGSKYYSVNDIWDRKPCYLGPCTLRKSKARIWENYQR